MTFTEFLMAAVHPDDVLTSSKLLSAFKSFDMDGGGSISVQEFQRVVDPDGLISDNHWQHIFDDIDDDGSGEINLEEFTEMMQKIF